DSEGAVVGRQGVPVVVEEPGEALPPGEVRRDEEPLAVLERLVEPGLRLERTSQRHFRLPAAAEAVELPRIDQGDDSEFGVELEVRAEREARLEEGRSPGLRRRGDPEDVALAIRDDLVTDDLEVAEAVDALEVVAQCDGVERAAGLRLDEVRDRPRVHSRDR